MTVTDISHWCLSLVSWEPVAGVCHWCVSLAAVAGICRWCHGNKLLVCVTGGSSWCLSLVSWESVLVSVTGVCCAYQLLCLSLVSVAGVWLQFQVFVTGFSCKYLSLVSASWCPLPVTGLQVKGLHTSNSAVLCYMKTETTTANQVKG